MGVLVTNIRISNFRSIGYCDIVLNRLNLIIGQNSVGKSNVLRALTIALNGNYTVSEHDIRVEKDEDLDTRKIAIIDIMIRPTDENEEVTDIFSNFWVSTFTEDWISTDLDGRSFVGIRTQIYYDSGFDQYRIKKCPIQVWDDDIEKARVGKRLPFSQDMQTYILCFYLDAHRDILDDLKNKKSYFGRAISSSDFTPDLIREIETDLNAVNQKIIDNTPALHSAQETISRVGGVIGRGTELQIEPVSRKIDDLQRGMDVRVEEPNSANLSIADQGMGTRSWASFLSLDAYIERILAQKKAVDNEAEFLILLTLEEPEAHLHSHAQKRLFHQITSFPGQKVISTHSANVLANAPIESLIHLYRDEAATKVHKIKKSQYSSQELEIIQRELIRSKGDLLFSTAIVLAEGITEETALPIFFKSYFGQETFSAGVSII